MIDPALSFFLFDTLLSFIFGFIIGGERELKDKPAGISTHTFVIGASMMLTYISRSFNPNNPTLVVAQIVSGVGFLGAGIIMRSDQGHVTNLTTAASVWFSAGIGIALGFDLHLVAFIATIYSVITSQIPNLRHLSTSSSRKSA